MRREDTLITFACLLFGLCLAAQVAKAQAPCTLETMTGTYAFYDKGSSLVLDLTANPFPVHWAGAVAPFVAVGEITFGPDGVGDGFYWIRVGSLNGGFDPVPVRVTITEMNQDCTGKYRYSVTLPGAPSATLIEERFVLTNNGRQFSSVPTFIGESGIPTLAWLGSGQRIRKPSDPVNNCGLQTGQGTFLFSAENIVTLDFNTGLADTLLIHMDVTSNGDYTGMLYEKFGPMPVELPVSGAFLVSPNCSVSWDLNVVINEVPTKIGIRGVIFNQGKNFYGLSMEKDVFYSSVQGVRVSP